MEQWIIDAKNCAKQEAEDFVENLKYIAYRHDLDETWFVDEVVKNIHIIKDNNND